MARGWVIVDHARKKLQSAMSIAGWSIPEAWYPLHDVTRTMNAIPYCILYKRLLPTTQIHLDRLLNRSKVELSPRVAIVFGSFSRSEELACSDLDIAIVTP